MVRLGFARRPLQRQEYEIQKPAIECSSRFIANLQNSEESKNAGALQFLWKILLYPLGCTGRRDDKFLVFVNAIGIADGRIGGGEAGPGRGTAQV
jgi:hypothetical protein